MMVLISGGVALIVGAVAALALDSWLVLVAVMAIHAIGSALVVGYSWKKTGEDYDKPDPLAEARIEEEEQGSGQPRASRTARDREVFN